MKDRILPCGCRHCGCTCPEHSPDGQFLCPAHREASTLLVLITLALIGAAAITWSAIYDSLDHRQIRQMAAETIIRADRR